jgi:hypothetical protein
MNKDEKLNMINNRHTKSQADRQKVMENTTEDEGWKKTAPTE